MSNNLGQIYATSKQAEKYIILDSQNVEVSGKIVSEANVLLGGNHKNYGTGGAFFASKDIYNNNNHSHAVYSRNDGLTSINSSGGNDVAITHENVFNHIFKGDGNTYHKYKVGINNTSPTVSLDIIQAGVEDLLNDNGVQPDLNNDNNSSIRMQYGSNHWDVAFANNDKNLHFLYNKANRGWLNDTFAAGQIDFTGQHRSSSNIEFTNNDVGLIVSSTGTYNNLSDDISPSIDEAIPIVELSVVQNDKKVFGVISNNEGKTREYHQGIFVSVAPKNADDNRLIINSLGEGAVWVSNKNGNLINGDYITSSSLIGYGMKQNEDILYNFTVAKITCDCEFNLTKKPKQKIKQIKREKIIKKYQTEIVKKSETKEEIIFDEITNSYVKKNIVSEKEEEVKLYDEYDLYDEDGNILEEKHKVYRFYDEIQYTYEIVYDENGDILFENDLDENGNIKYEYDYETRFLDENANILSGEEEYLSKLNNGDNVYIACLVGCTYHCG